MGFSNVVSQVVLFMSLLVSIVVLSLVYKSYVGTTNVSLETQQQKIIDKIDTSFVIEEGYYDLQNVFLKLKNNGALKLDPNNVDIFIGNNRIMRENRVLSLDENTNIVNGNHWDPGEILFVNVSKVLQTGPEIVRVAVENGVTRSVIIQV